VITLKTAIAAILVFGVLIFIHEFGHFLVAKLVGVRVEEFSIGMGPSAFSKKKGDTLYSIRILPFGGYVKMTGEAGLEEDSDIPPDDPRRFNNKTVAQRMGVIVAGPLMNLFLAVVIFAIVFTFIGVPFVDTTISEVVENSPADQAGLKAGDTIVAIDGEKVSEWSEMVFIIQNRVGEELELTVNRNGEEKIFMITPKMDPETQVGIIGVIQNTPQWRKMNPVQALVTGFTQTVEIIVLTLVGIAQLITGQLDSGGVAGPVGIIQLIGESARVGLVYLLNLTAIISINLGLLNLFPIPALDGSKLIFLGIEALRGKPIDAKKENFVHLIGFALLMLLMIFITYNDILRLFE